ncbi:prepilin-type N-terminal cleavage/methylation domain-containing protein [Lampropedia puyangensis]|uniref:Type II secretion system protein H n=1 Tax=Lampropedia puyangensis TaxID=1330072 RepID=A0A4S8EYS2_9BURK|nr:GspH/FimT family pseudopilin [Lampropedia puyangensis]THT99400.1 prepilin-type N-terminal cleavage/methylation domain-containing protein [Lampropedia puyangensis]
MKKFVLEHPVECREHGFTMIELLVVITIAAVLAALALPSFDSMVKRWRVRSAAENVVSAIYLARSEAARLGGVKFVRETPQGCAIGNGQWQCGWRVESMEATPQVLQQAEPSKGILIKRSQNGNEITFNQYGQPSGLGAYSFVIIPVADDQKNDKSRAMVVCASSGGRVRTLTGVDACS